MIVELIIAASATLVGAALGLILSFGVIKMHENHPDYKGDDWLNW